MVYIETKEKQNLFDLSRSKKTIQHFHLSGFFYKNIQNQNVRNALSQNKLYKLTFIL